MLARDEPLVETATDRRRSAGRLPIWVARALFILLAVAPLLCTATWAAWRQVALSTDDYEAWLGARLGLEVRLVSLTHPRPNREQVAEAEILDPETGFLLAKAKNIAIENSSELMRLRVESLLIPRNRLMDLWQLLHDRAMRERRLLQRPIAIEADQVLISSPKGQTELTNWQLRIERRDEGSFAITQFVENRPDAKPVEAFISRQLHQNAWTTEFDLLTETHIKASTLFGETDWLAGFGEVSLSGHLWIEWAGDKWSGDFAGTVEGLTLGALVNKRYPHQLDGNARASIRKLEIVDGQIRHLEGQLNSREGQISASLLHAAGEFLGMQVSQPVTQGLVSFDELGVLFSINPHGLTLRGCCEASVVGAILVANGEALLTESGDRPRHTFSLIQALANERTNRIFWTDACKPLLDLLPPPK